jgi:hypothetical protein
MLALSGKRLLMCGGALEFVALRKTNGAASAFTFSSAEIGGLAIVFAQSTTTTPVISVSAGSWTTTDPGAYNVNGVTMYVRRIFTKVLTAGDVTSGLTLGSISASPNGAGGAVLHIVRGPTSIAVKSNNGDAGGVTTLSLAGHAPAANSKGVVAFVVDLDATATFVPPATPISNVRLAAVIEGGFTYGVYDWGPGDYLNQALAFTGFSSTNRQNGVLLELL